jgi:AcrR family transcriptional regulator
MGRTRKVVEDRREQILEAALVVFAEKGFERATNKDIAREAGITPGLIYHYFKSKQDVLTEAIEKHSPLSVIRSLTPEMLDLPAETFLRTVLEELFSVLESERFGRLMRVFLPAAIHGGVAAPILFSAMREATSMLEGYFTRKMDSGELRKADPGLTTHLFLGGVMDLTLRRQVTRDPEVLRYSKEQIVNAVLSLTLRGLKP